MLIGIVYLIIDRINQTISSEIEVVAESKSKKQEESNFTRIEIRLPLIHHLLDLDKLKKFITGYVTFNTHIDFIFKIHSGSSSDQTNKDDGNTTLSFPQDSQSTQNGHLLVAFIIILYQNFRTLSLG